MQHFLEEGSPGCMPNASLNPSLIKRRKSYNGLLVLFLGLSLSIGPSLGIFLPTPLGALCRL